ncbi:MAG: hypothetical protein MR265_02250 [Erysipelotrichaceae bacterium]|nr:hypothetical protein [Erysipelotrichaceae bacterium]
MKKLLFPFFAIFPMVVNAESIAFDLKCDREKYNLDDLAKCYIIINNPELKRINSVSFESESTFENANSKFKFSNELNKYIINLNGINENSIDVFDFDYKVTKDDLVIKNIDFKLKNLADFKIKSDFVKTFSLKEKPYLTNILINNQELSNFNKETLEYNYYLVDDLKYLEIKTFTDEGNKIKDNFGQKLINIENLDTITIEVNNSDESSIYKINLIREHKNLLKSVKINEIKFKFNPLKFSYYFEVPNDVEVLNFNYESEDINGKFQLNSPILDVGDNVITLINNDVKYTFNVRRLAEGEKVNNVLNLKYLRIGDSYINLKDDVYVYKLKKENNILAKVGTVIDNQDYEIKYYDDQILINLFDFSGNSKQYKITLQDNVDQNIVVDKYDNTTTIIIFCVFSVLFIIISAIVIYKHREYKKNF